MTDKKVAANDETEARVPAKAPSGNAQADGPAFEAGQQEAANAMDEAGPASWDEGVEWEPGDEAGTQPGAGDDLPATDEIVRAGDGRSRGLPRRSRRAASSS